MTAQLALKKQSATQLLQILCNIKTSPFDSERNSPVSVCATLEPWPAGHTVRVKVRCDVDVNIYDIANACVLTTLKSSQNLIKDQILTQGNLITIMKNTVT